MIIGIPKEIKQGENRVAITPVGVERLSQAGHKILVEKNAGIGSGISDEEFGTAGATIVNSAEEVFSKSKMILKVKEPLKVEYPLIKPNQIIFTYFHFASSEELTKAMMESKAVCVAYETVEDNGELPLLKPMSEVAGKMSMLVGAYYLSKINNGRGILLSGVTNVEPANVVVIGGGVVGMSAANLAKSMGAKVTTLQRLGKTFDLIKRSHPELNLIESTPENIIKELKKADLVIGAVYVTGARAPKIVTRDMIKQMQAGSVIVDVAVDQGGIFETSRPTTHSNPIFVEEDVIHYCVANMPAAFPRTSTYALTTATLPYAVELANNGVDGFKKNRTLLTGLNIFNGNVTNKGVAESFGLEYTNPLTVLE